MKCNNCGFEHEMDFAYCPVCGQSTQAATTFINPAAYTVLTSMKDSLFLVICILMAVSCVFSIASGALPLLNILATVFLWLAYAQSRKDIADSAQLRNVSGTVYAQYIITYVVAGLLLLVGLILAAAFSLLATDAAAALPAWPFLSEFAAMPDYYGYVASAVTAVSGWLILFIFVILAVILLLINIFSMRYIHRFVKSVYTSINTGVLQLEHVNAAKNWLIVFAVFSGIGALSALATGEFDAGVASGASCAMYILGSMLIRKYFITEE